MQINVFVIHYSVWCQKTKIVLAVKFFAYISTTIWVGSKSAVRL